MRWPRVRFTARRLILAVTFAAMLAGAAVEDDRRHRRAEAAASDRIRAGASVRRAEAAERKRKEVLGRIARLRGEIMKNEMWARGSWDHPEMVAQIVSYDDVCRDELASEVRWAEYYTKLRAKHLDTASRPWLAVAPEPPEPE